MSKDQALLKSYNLNGLELPNRVVMAPMTRSRADNEGNVPTVDLQGEYYKQRASAGLIISEGSQVSEEAVGYIHTPGFHTEAQVEGWKKVTDIVHQEGGRIFIQLWHVGRMSHPDFHNGKKPLAPSAINPNSKSFTPEGFKDTVTPQEMSLEDIKRTIQDFKKAAENAVKAGFDGVEIHGAHGYLICQFLGTATNRRTDQWGGSLPNRARFLMKIIERIRQKTSESFLVGVRISPEYNQIGIVLEDSLDLVDLLVESEIDFLHISCWDCFIPPTHSDDPRMVTEIFAERLANRLPMISCGAVWSTKHALQVMEQGTDLVGVARAGIGHSDWAIHLDNRDYDPQRPPFTAEHLRSEALSEKFIEYMRNWKDFVES